MMFLNLKWVTEKWVFKIYRAWYIQTDWFWFFKVLSVMINLLFAMNKHSNAVFSWIRKLINHLAGQRQINHDFVFNKITLPIFFLINCKFSKNSKRIAIESNVKISKQTILKLTGVSLDLQTLNFFLQNRRHTLNQGGM